MASRPSRDGVGTHGYISCGSQQINDKFLPPSATDLNCHFFLIFFTFITRGKRSSPKGGGSVANEAPAVLFLPSLLKSIFSHT